MKLLFFSLIIFSLSFWTVSAQVAASESQRQAIKAYPSLGIEGSPLNRAFVAAVAKAKVDRDPILSQPNWPLLLAASAAEKLGIVESAEIKPTPTPDATPWVPQNTTLGGPAGSALDNDPSQKRWGIVGSVFQKATDGVLVTCTSSGGGYKSPGPGAKVFLRQHPDFRLLVDGDKIKCTALEAGTYEYVSVLGARKTIRAFTFYRPLH